MPTTDIAGSNLELRLKPMAPQINLERIGMFQKNETALAADQKKLSFVPGELGLIARGLLL